VVQAVDHVYVAADMGCEYPEDETFRVLRGRELDPPNGEDQYGEHGDRGEDGGDAGSGG
jgi:hypothetical protein